MTDLTQRPARPPSPFRVPPQPLPANPQQDFYAPAPPPQYSAPPQDSAPPQYSAPPQNSAPPQYSAPPQNSAPPQHSAGPTGALSAESKSPMAALVCGIVSYLGPGWFTAIPAIIFGVKGRRASREGRTPNGGMATTGLWLGIVNLVVAPLIFGILLATAIPVFLNQRAKGIDVALRGDMEAMITLQNAHITNTGEPGFEVAATSPGGAAAVPDGAFTARAGNVIAVELGPDGYCLSAYNPGASYAKSPTASMVYRYGENSISTKETGVC